MVPPTGKFGMGKGGSPTWVFEVGHCPPPVLKWAMPGNCPLRCRWVPLGLVCAGGVLASSCEFKEVRVTRTDCTKAC